MIEPSETRPLAIRLRLASGQRHRRFQATGFFGFIREGKSFAVGQAEIAQQRVEAPVSEKDERFPQIRGDSNLMPAMSQQIGQDRPAFPVILHQKNIHQYRIV